MAICGGARGGMGGRKAAQGKVMAMNTKEDKLGKEALLIRWQRLQR
jgi:hypothetical protein